MTSRPARQPSLRRTLMVWLLLSLLMLVPLSATLIYRQVLSPVLDALDRDLTDVTIALAQILVVEGDAPRLPLSEQTARALRADPVDEVSFAVGDAAGQLLAGSRELLALAPALQAGERLFFGAVLNGTPVRVAAHGKACGDDPGRICAIVVAETLGKRAAAERAALLAALLGAAALALPMLALVLLAARRALRPLDQAAHQIEGLGPDRLSQLDTAQMPREVLGFVRALNRLLARLDTAATVQRHFVANAAHQLRTPLAVMRIEAARALAAPHPSDQQPSLERLHAAAERGARLAQQLLTLARAEGLALGGDAPRQRLDLATLATTAAERWLHASLEAGQDLGFALQPAWVDGDATLLDEALGNLIHNAIEHAGRGARITVSCGLSEGQAFLSVEDDGPGVPAEEREALWERFRRGPQAQGSGSGLGLAIVADIARLHGGSATLDSGADGRGLCVTLSLPEAGAPT